MALNRHKSNRTAKSTVLGVLSLLLAAPILLFAAGGGLRSLGHAGERAAVLSAALQMPDSSMELLEQRFRDQFFGEAEKTPAAEPKKDSTAAAPAPSPDETQGAENSGTAAAPKIPDKYAAPIISEDFSGRDNSNLLEYKSGLIKNETTFEDEEVLALLEHGMKLRFADTGDPQVLIVHTHATEAFEQYDAPQYDTRNTWRSTDNNRNMVALGAAMAQVLEENGIGVIHDTTQHDYPSYNGSYDRSAKTIKSYLEEYPTIRVVLDLHRDAMQRDDAIVKPVTEIGGKKVSQVMIIAACDDGTMNIPEWRENLRFAVTLQDYMETVSPGLTRPVYFCYRKYNMDLTTGSLLIEFGTNANTLEEGICSAQLCGQALADLINDYKDEE